MSDTPRQRFLNYVRDPDHARGIVSPFLPAPDVVRETLQHLGLSISEDAFQNEIRLSRELDYEPMFMTDLNGQIFPWQVDPERSDKTTEVSTLPTPKGEWVRRFPKKEISWNDDAQCPVQTETDHEKFVLVCEQIHERETQIRDYFTNFRQRVGETGVIVIGHPHPSWLCYQISPATIFYHWNDFPDVFQKSMDAVFEASLFVMQIALDAGVDFMSDSSYGLEMTSPELFDEMDLPYIQKFAEWTHERNGLFWYHNCGFTRDLITTGRFDKMGADVIETIAPPPEGDNDLSESRQRLSRSICSKGNLSLILLRDGTSDEVAEATEKMVSAIKGYPHIISTADAVLKGTPPANFIAFVETARKGVP